MPMNILSDCETELTGYYSRMYYSVRIRMIKYLDKEDQKAFVYLTIAKHKSNPRVADLYKNGWQVELFFK